jgi:hypothetical protein
MDQGTAVVEDNDNNENVDEEKHSGEEIVQEENDVNISMESLISESNASYTIDNQRLKGRSKTLTSIKTDKLDAIPESDDDETDQDEKNLDELATEHLVFEEQGLVHDREDAEAITKENTENDHENENLEDGEEEEDIPALMMREVEEQASQEQEDPFPVEDWDTFM